MFKLGTAGFALKQARAAPLIQECHLAAGNFPNLSDRISRSLDYSPPTTFLNCQLGEGVFWERWRGAGQGKQGRGCAESLFPPRRGGTTSPCPVSKGSSMPGTPVVEGSGGSGNISTNQLLSHLPPATPDSVFRHHASPSPFILHQAVTDPPKRLYAFQHKAATK